MQKQRSENIEFTNQDICNLLTEQTGQKWSFKIVKHTDNKIEQKFPDLGSSYVIKFFTEYYGFTVKDEINKCYNIEKCVQSLATMKNINWFETWFAPKSIEDHYILRANTRFKNSIFAIKEIPKQIKNCIAREIMSCPDDYKIKSTHVKHELRNAFRDEIASHQK